MPETVSKPPQTTVCQKVAIISALATFVALSSLTASLPLNLVSHQRSESENSPKTASIQSGDVAWMIVATILSILSGPVVAYLYSNIYGKTNNTLLMISIIIAALVTFLWILVSFSFVWGLDANGDQIMGFPKSYYMFAHAGNLPSERLFTNLPTSIFAVFELSFAIVTPIIIAAGVIDRVNIYGLLAFFFIWHLCVWSPVAHIVWNPRGFYKTNHIIDFAGGIVVNIMAGLTTLVLNLFLDYKQAPKAPKAVTRNPENALFSAFGLWFLWFGLTVGKAHAAGEVAAQATVNTITTVIVSILLNYIADFLFDVPYTNVQLINAILLGLVSASPCSGYVTVGGALLITIITVITTRGVARNLLKDGMNDEPYSVLTVHGIGGTVAFLFTAMFAYRFVNDDISNGLTFGKQNTIRHQTAAVLATWACGFLAIGLTAFLSDLIVPLSRYDQNPNNDWAPVGLGPLRESFKENAAPEAKPEGEQDA